MDEEEQAGEGPDRVAGGGTRERAEHGREEGEEEWGQDEGAQSGRPRDECCERVSASVP